MLASAPSDTTRRGTAPDDTPPDDAPDASDGGSDWSTVPKARPKLQVEPDAIPDLIEDLRSEMMLAAEDLAFERAAELRDEIRLLEDRLLSASGKTVRPRAVHGRAR